MITIYTTDNMGVYFESLQISESSAIPFKSSLSPPPQTTGLQVSQLIGKQWVVLPEYPVPTPTLPQVPQSVSMRQARLALLSAGLLASIDATIAALPSPQKEAAQIEWEYSQEVQRYNGFVSVLAHLLGLTEQQIDELFILAATL